MCISGFWHGAGYLFILWGALHGIYLSINHGWRLIARNLWTDKKRYARVMQPIGFVLTFVSVATAMVFFRASTMHAAMDIVRGMVGLNGVELPQSVFAHLGPLAGLLQSVGIGVTPPDFFPFTKLAIWLFALAILAFFAPNTQQLLAKYEPALGFKTPATDGLPILRRLHWTPSLTWALFVAAVAAVGVLQLSGPSEFLYWQF
jgi:hypothetical protein